MASQKIRIKLKAYDHELLDQSAQRIVDTVKATGTKVSGPVPLPTDREVITVHPRGAQVQGIREISSKSRLTSDS